MKRTKNMFYQESCEATELYLYAVNDSFCYEKIIIPVLDNLKRKVKRGIYDSEKAVDAFYSVATGAAKQYHKEFGSRFGNQIFSVTDRFTVAVEMEERYHDYILGLE